LEGSLVLPLIAFFLIVSFAVAPRTLVTRFCRFGEIQRVAPATRIVVGPNEPATNEQQVGFREKRVAAAVEAAEATLQLHILL